MEERYPVTLNSLQTKYQPTHPPIDVRTQDTRNATIALADLSHQPAAKVWGNERDGYTVELINLYQYANIPARLASYLHRAFSQPDFELDAIEQAVNAHLSVLNKLPKSFTPSPLLYFNEFLFTILVSTDNLTSHNLKRCFELQDYRKPVQHARAVLGSTVLLSTSSRTQWTTRMKETPEWDGPMVGKKNLAYSVEWYPEKSPELNTCITMSRKKVGLRLFHAYMHFNCLHAHQFTNSAMMNYYMLEHIRACWLAYNKLSTSEQVPILPSSVISSDPDVDVVSRAAALPPHQNFSSETVYTYSQFNDLVRDHLFDARVYTDTFFYPGDVLDVIEASTTPHTLKPLPGRKVLIDTNAQATLVGSGDIAKPGIVHYTSLPYTGCALGANTLQQLRIPPKVPSCNRDFSFGHSVLTYPMENDTATPLPQLDDEQRLTMMRKNIDLRDQLNSPIRMEPIEEYSTGDIFTTLYYYIAMHIFYEKVEVSFKDGDNTVVGLTLRERPLKTNASVFKLISLICNYVYENPSTLDHVDTLAWTKVAHSVLFVGSQDEPTIEILKSACPGWKVLGMGREARNGLDRTDIETAPINSRYNLIICDVDQTTLATSVDVAAGIELQATKLLTQCSTCFMKINYTLSGVINKLCQIADADDRALTMIRPGIAKAFSPEWYAVFSPADNDYDVNDPSMFTHHETITENTGVSVLPRRVTISPSSVPYSTKYRDLDNFWSFGGFSSPLEGFSGNVSRCLSSMKRVSVGSSGDSFGCKGMISRSRVAISRLFEVKKLDVELQAGRENIDSNMRMRSVKSGTAYRLATLQTIIEDVREMPEVCADVVAIGDRQFNSAPILTPDSRTDRSYTLVEIPLVDVYTTGAPTPCGIGKFTPLPTTTYTYISEGLNDTTPPPPTKTGNLRVVTCTFVVPSVSEFNPTTEGGLADQSALDFLDTLNVYVNAMGSGTVLYFNYYSENALKNYRGSTSDFTVDLDDDLFSFSGYAPVPVLDDSEVEAAFTAGQVTRVPVTSLQMLKGLMAEGESTSCLATSLLPYFNKACPLYRYVVA